jgi:hypothetical protein
MNMMPLIQRLEAAGVGAPGTSLFINIMPTECELGVLLKPPLTGTKIDYELPGYFKTSLQVVARSHDYNTGLLLAKQAVTALLITSDTVVDNMTIRFLRPKHQPVAFPLSEGNFIEFNVSMEVCYNADE